MSNIGEKHDPEVRAEGRREEQRDQGLSTARLAGGGEGRASAAEAAPAGEEQQAPLFSPNQTTELRSAWDSVQASFVDEPRQAVEKADKLVAAAMKQMAEMFASERGKLEGQWDRGDSVSTEDLRLALRRYRSFFNRLLNF